MMRLSSLLSLLICCRVSGADLVPGTSVFGEHNFIEYIPGDLPLVIAAPHGGQLTPEEIPDRTNGVNDTDANTQELARTLAAVIHAETGRHMHLIICRLSRSKLDANRDLSEAAQDSEIAAKAWKEHHDFIDQACDAAVKQFGVVFLIDLHGHGHADPRVELGYLHGALALADCDEALNESSYVNASSMRWIVERSQLSHAELLKGPQSLGALLEANGYPATPSPRMPVPTEPYFRGGYTIARHCKAERNITGLQIEANRQRLRDTAEHRLLFSRALAQALGTYFSQHLGFDLHGRGNVGSPEKPWHTQPTATQQ